MYIYIYGPSIRKNPHTHIHHPVLRIAARHHRLPSSLSGRHPRRSQTLPPYGFRPSATRIPPHLNPPEDTNDCSLYHTYTSIHLPPSPYSPARHPTQASTSASIPSHPSHRPCGSPDPDSPTRARSVYNRKFKVFAGSARPLHTRQRSERRSGRPGRPTTPRIPTDTRTGSVLPWPNNPLIHDGNPSMRTSADAASTT